MDIKNLHHLSRRRDIPPSTKSLNAGTLQGFALNTELELPSITAENVPSKLCQRETRPASPVEVKLCPANLGANGGTCIGQYRDNNISDTISRIPEHIQVIMSDSSTTGLPGKLLKVGASLRLEKGTRYTSKTPPPGVSPTPDQQSHTSGERMASGAVDMTLPSPSSSSSTSSTNTNSSRTSSPIASPLTQQHFHLQQQQTDTSLSNGGPLSPNSSSTSMAASRCSSYQRPLTPGSPVPSGTGRTTPVGTTGKPLGGHPPVPLPAHNIPMPWKKRPLKPGGTNFHSIADLVTPSNTPDNSPACVTSRMLPMPPPPPAASTPPGPHYHLDSRVHRGTGSGVSPPPPRSVSHHLELESTPGRLGKHIHRGDHFVREDASPTPAKLSRTAPEFDEDIVDVDGPVVFDSLPKRNNCSSPSDLHPAHHNREPNTSTIESSSRTSSSPLTSSCRSPGANQFHDTSSSVSSSPPAPGVADAEVADPNRLRKGRTIYKAQQVYVLEQVFSRTHYPDPEVIETLSRELDISENKIKVWFQNKRARWRRRAAETGLPPQPIGFTLSGTPGLPTSWPHHASLPPGVLMPQPMYSSPYGGPQVAPRPGFPAHISHLTGLSSSPLYLGFDSSLVHPAAKSLSGPALLPYGSYPMSVLSTPTHVWGESPKLPGT